MKALKYVLFLLLISFIGTIIYIAVQPNSFKVKKTTKTLNAPVSVIYNELIDIKTWGTWSPWNKKIQSIETLETTTNTSIKQLIVFEDFPTSEITWLLKPHSNGTTTVSCLITVNHLPFSTKAVRIFSNTMEHEIVVDLKRGLKKLEIAAIASTQAYSIKINGIENYCGGYYLYSNSASKMDKLRAKMNTMASKLIKYAKSNNIEMAGKPFILYHNWNKENNMVDFSCCVPTTEEVIISDNRFLSGKFEDFNALKVTLKGDYKNLSETWRIANKHLRDNYIEEHNPEIRIEKHIIDSKNTPNSADWITEIYIAVIN